MRINKQVIEDLKPCVERYENYLKHYPDFDGELWEFFELTGISHVDKLWMSLRLLNRDILECFALDCAVSAKKHAAAAADADAADAAADAAAYAAAAAAERANQLEAILWLVDI